MVLRVRYNNTVRILRKKYKNDNNREWVSKMAAVLGESLTPYLQSQPSSHWPGDPITLPSKSTPDLTPPASALVSHHGFSPVLVQPCSLLLLLLSSIWFSHNSQDSLFFSLSQEIFQWLLITFGEKKIKLFALACWYFWPHLYPSLALLATPS